MKQSAAGWDVIGDVHGKCDALRALLSRLGYRPQRNDVWRHPARRALFLGDLVDRGDDVAGVLKLVKAMADAGQARVLLGNHEYNLLCWYTPDQTGGYRRARNAGNAGQVAHTIPHLDRIPQDRERYLAWFRRLPIAMTIGDARFVHAYWGEPEMRTLAGRNTLDACGWDAPGFCQSAAGKAVELLIKGPELRLPGGLEIVDRQGTLRRNARIKWWQNGAGRTFREMVLPDHPALEGRRFPAQRMHSGRERGPVFFGHYGFRSFPGLLGQTTACVDYTGADNGGIGAYRWNGERELREENFVH